MDDAEHGVSVAGEMLEQRGVRARQAGVAVREDEERKTARARCRRRVELGVRTNALQRVEGELGAEQPGEGPNFGDPFAQIRRDRASATRRRIPGEHLDLTEFAGGGERLATRSIGQVP